MEPHQRLKEAREKAGFEQAVDAARAFGWKVSTYISHENGTRGIRKDVAERYAKAFRAPSEWLLLNKGKKAIVATAPLRTVPVVGYVGAADRAFFVEAGDLTDDAPAPVGATDRTVAVEIRGESLGDVFDRWLAYYDDVHRPVTQDQIGRLCVVGLRDGRILVKKIQSSKGRKGLYHLISNGNTPPILDVEIEWAAKVINMVPR